MVIPLRGHLSCVRAEAVKLTFSACFSKIPPDCLYTWTGSPILGGVSCLLCFRWQWIKALPGTGKGPPSAHAHINGLYMFGGVGTGKTMLMDLFVQACPPEFQVIMVCHLSLDLHWALHRRSSYCPFSRNCVTLTAGTIILWPALGQLVNVLAVPAQRRGYVHGCCPCAITACLSRWAIKVV